MPIADGCSPRRFADGSGDPVTAGTASDRLSTAQRRGSLWLARLESPLAAYYLILGSGVALVVIGLVMVLSSSSVESLVESQNPYQVFSKQAMFAAIGLPMAWLAYRVPIRFWKSVAWVVFGVAVLSLIAVTLFGHNVNGNQNWLKIGPITVQPSEAAKLALVLWAAAVLSSKQSLLDRMSHMLVPVVPGSLLLIALVMAGNDLGTAMVLIGITGALLFVAGAPLRVFAFGGLLAAAVIAVLVTTSPHRMNRLNVWSGAECDYYRDCWQTTHAMWGLATGGWWGVGLGVGQEKWSWLPEAHNDFIFAVIGEELGLAGALTVLLLFALLGVGLYRLAVSTDDFFVTVVSGGVLAWILGQAMINIGTVLKVLPVIGVPLPLVSSGGSALVTTMIALGMLLGFARRVPGAAQALAARRSVGARAFAVLPGRRSAPRAGASRSGRGSASRRSGPRSTVRSRSAR